MLENGNRVFGVLLMIFASMRNDGAVSIRCSISSWYVAPEFRIFGSMMVSQALKHPFTYLNISPARHTFLIIEAQRFRRFCEGTFAAVPVLARDNGKTRISWIKDPTRPKASVPLNELQLLGDHERLGCISLWCKTRDGWLSFNFPTSFRRWASVAAMRAAHLLSFHGRPHARRWANWAIPGTPQHAAHAHERSCSTSRRVVLRRETDVLPGA
jgi:hypothetical protein